MFCNGKLCKYTADFTFIQSHTVDVTNALAWLYDHRAGITDAVWNAGISKFLDDQKRPIIYGADSNDNLASVKRSQRGAKMRSI